MILSDFELIFLSRQKNDYSNPHKIIPISLNMRNLLHDRDCNIRNVRTEDNYLVWTQSQSKSSSINLSKVYGVDKGLNPHQI